MATYNFNSRQKIRIKSAAEAHYAILPTPQFLPTMLFCPRSAAEGGKIAGVAKIGGVAK